MKFGYRSTPILGEPGLQIANTCAASGVRVSAQWRGRYSVEGETLRVLIITAVQAADRLNFIETCSAGLFVKHLLWTQPETPAPTQPRGPRFMSMEKGYGFWQARWGDPEDRHSINEDWRDSFARRLKGNLLRKTRVNAATGSGKRRHLQARKALR